MNPQVTAGGSGVVVPADASPVAVSSSPSESNISIFLGGTLVDTLATVSASASNNYFTAESQFVSAATGAAITLHNTSKNNYTPPTGATFQVPASYAPGTNYFWRVQEEFNNQPSITTGTFDVVAGSSGTAATSAFGRVSYIAANAAPSASPGGLAAYTLDAGGLLTDGSVGDTATGYSAPAASGFYLAALYAFGSPTTITAYSLQVETSQGAGGQCNFYGSNDGSSWTSIDSFGAPTSGGKHTNLYTGGSPAGGQQTGAAINVTYRYYALVSSGGGSPQNISTLSDARLWDAQGNLVLPQTDPQIQAGTTLTCAIQGTYTRGSGGWDGQHTANENDNGAPLSYAWAIDRDDNEVAAANPEPEGWNAVKVSGQNQIAITVSAAAIVEPRYCAYVATDGTGDAQTYWFVVFDVVSGSGQPVTYPAQTVVEAAVSESGQRGGLRRSIRAAALAVFTAVASAGSVSSPGPITSYSPRMAVASAVSQMPAPRGPASYGPRTAVNAAFAEFVPSAAQGLPGQTVQEAVFGQLASRDPATFALRLASEGVVFSSAARGGHVAAAGSTAPPILALEPGAFTSACSRGAVAFAPRTATLPALTEMSATGDRTQALRAAQNAVFSQSAAAGLLSAAPLPGVPDDRDPFVVLAAEVRFLLAQMLGSPMTQNAALLAIFDKLAASYRINELSQLANTLTGLPVLIRGGDGVSSTQYGFGQDAPILALLPAADGMILGANPALVLGSLYRPFMQPLISYLSKLGFASLDAYLTSLNTPAPYQALVHPSFALISYLFNNQQGTLLLSPSNVFAPQTTFGTAQVGAAAGSVAFTHLSDIPAANVVSQAAGQSTQGYTAAPGVTATVTAPVNGTLTVSLIAFGESSTGAAVSGRHWSAVLDNAAAGAAAAFTPQNAGDRLYGITSVSGQGTATDGALTLGSVLERVVS